MNRKKKYKVLLISHSALNDTNNVGKTLCQLFSNYKKTELTQIYFNKITPNVDRCDSWFEISDVDVLKTIFTQRKYAGHVLLYEDYNVQQEASSLYKKSVGQSPLKLLCRDIIWCFGKWQSSVLDDWVISNKPRVIFLAPGYSIFAYKVAIYISEKFNIPLTMFIMDDFYNELRFSLSPAFWVRLLAFRLYFRKSIKTAKRVFCINETMSDIYRNLFKIETITLYSPCDEKDHVIINYTRYRFIYGGGISNDRGELLLTLSSMLENYPSATIDLFGKCSNEIIINKISKMKNATYHGAVSSVRLNEEIDKSDIVVFVESFRKKSLAKTKLSLSTKIPEYLASGKLILAIGPSTQESIRYLCVNQAGIVVDDLAQLEKVLCDVLYGKINCNYYIKNAIELAKKNHNKIKIANILDSALLECIDE